MLIFPPVPPERAVSSKLWLRSPAYYLESSTGIKGDLDMVSVDTTLKNPRTDVSAPDKVMICLSVRQILVFMTVCSIATVSLELLYVTVQAGHDVFECFSGYRRITNLNVEN